MGPIGANARGNMELTSSGALPEHFERVQRVPAAGHRAVR